MDKIQYFSNEPACACKVSLDFLGDKWMLIVIRDLFRFRKTFTEFMTGSNEKIATNILTDRLKKLKQFEIIDFRLNEKNKKVKEYYLTDRGVELYEIIYQLQHWTLNNVDFTHSENTKKWKLHSETNSRDRVIENYKENYRKFRKKTFSF